jgi:hypothetical protein
MPKSWQSWRRPLRNSIWWTRSLSKGNKVREVLFPGDQADGAEHPKSFDTVYLIKAEDSARKRRQRIVRLGEKLGTGDECVFSLWSCMYRGDSK